MQIRTLDQENTVSIAAMAPWDMFAIPESLGLDQETVDAMRERRLTPDQAMRAQVHMDAAFKALRDAEINVCYPGKPS